MRTSLLSRKGQELGSREWLGIRRLRLLHILALLFLFSTIWLTFHSVYAISFDHTSATVDMGCQQFTYSSDGNPFPLCPGPLPRGGNCVWWGWEQWHLLGYDLPLNWGNAADWIVDAERFGLPVGTMPRVGSLAVFPVADGVWAFGTAGHVAFVTSVSPDGRTFNVTYQDYGDPTPMYIGRGYNVSLINEPRYQQGQLRFIYFPRQIDPALFAQLPGINGNDLSGIAGANAQLNSAGSSGTQPNGLAIGLPPGAYDEEASADFAGLGLTDLLLYNRQQGRLDVLALSYPYQRYLPQYARHLPLGVSQAPYRVSLHDSQTPVNGWGPNLEIHLGDFTGSGQTEILLYDRVSGQIQLLTLTPQFAIAKHVTFAGWGLGWEVYVGHFDGKRSELLMYKRFAVSPPVPTPVPLPTPGSTAVPTPIPTRTPIPSPTVTPTPSPTVTPTPTPSPAKTPTPTPSPTATPTPTRVPSPTPTSNPTPTPTLGATSTPQLGSTLTHIQNTGLEASSILSHTQVTKLAAGGGEPVDTSGNSPADWTASGLTAEFFLVSFTSNFTVGTTQDYGLWHNSWEVYIGSFVGANHDGIFLYDRNVGEGRLLEFSAQFTLTQFQFLHNLGNNWEVHVGDFAGQGQAQILLYDAGTGEGQALILGKNLSVTKYLKYSGWGKGLVLYVGHFGMSSLNIMLYNPEKAQSTFIAFDTLLNVSHLYTARSWGQSEQILVGSFLNRTRCQAQNSCSAADNILVLNRANGEVQQYTFSFGNQFGVFDNRAQGFIREGMAATMSVLPVDATQFSLFASLDTTIHDEELY